MMLKCIYLFQVKHPNNTVDKIGNWLAEEGSNDH